MTAAAGIAVSGYREHVNPQWARLLDVLQMDVRYTRCVGAELFDDTGRRYLDFLSGYCVHNTGHNHPAIIAALKEELDRRGPAMLQSHVPELAGELAGRLCSLAGGLLKKVFFCSSGSEGVEAAIKFSRAHTGRNKLICANGAFHGLTCGALALMDGAFWRDGFGPLLDDVAFVPFGDLAALEAQLKDRKAAAYIVEPIQAEAGIQLPPGNYLADAQRLCRKYGTLFVLDEVQTGMFRTGPFLAAHHYGVTPDIVILAKALSGGLIPSGAVLMSDPIYDSVYGSLKRSLVHTSTYSENQLAMRAGLATLDVLESQALGKRAEQIGNDLRGKLRDALGSYEMVAEVRGQGLLNGIAFKSPNKLSLRVTYETFAKIHPAMFGQLMVMRMFHDRSILTQVCGNNFMVWKAAPPLIVDDEQIDQYVASAVSVVDAVHTSASFWTEALGVARRAVNI